MAPSHAQLLCRRTTGVVKAQDPAFLAQLDKQLAADKQEDGRSAKQFCSSPDFRKMTCGFASDAEVEATIKKQCPLCGTLYRNLPDKLPAEVTGVDRYNQWGIRLISLACKGPVVVRSVFKILEEPPVKQQPGWEGTNCTNSALVQVDDKSVSEGGQASEVVRCELQLGTSGGSEVERALAAKEGRCWQCGLCSTGKGCPSNKGTWYSDTYTTVARGCSFDPQQGYEYHRSGININPFTKILLAKYEVCNSPGCFNAEAEQAKIKAAKACVKGKCAA